MQLTTPHVLQQYIAADQVTRRAHVAQTSHMGIQMGGRVVQDMRKQMCATCRQCQTTQQNLTKPLEIE